MKKQFRLIRTLRKDISVIFIFCIGVVIVINLWLNQIPEFFSNGAELGEIVNKLCIAYISAFIFYFLVVHIKQQKDKANIYEYASRKVYNVIGCGTGMIHEMSNHLNISLSNNYPTEEELDRICNSINPNSRAPLILGVLGNYANWLQFLDYYRKRSNEATQKIFSAMPFLDSELVNLLAKIEASSYFSSLSKIVNTSIQNQNLSFLKPTILDYLKLIQKLEKYADKRLKIYAQ